VITHQSDVWSGCVTMMNVLVGKETNSEAHAQVSVTQNYIKHAVVYATQISKFLHTATKIVRRSSSGIDQCYQKLEQIVRTVCV